MINDNWRYCLPDSLEEARIYIYSREIFIRQFPDQHVHLFYALYHLSAPQNSKSIISFFVFFSHLNGSLHYFVFKFYRGLFILK